MALAEELRRSSASEERAWRLLRFMQMRLECELARQLTADSGLSFRRRVRQAEPAFEMSGPISLAEAATAAEVGVESTPVAPVVLEVTQSRVSQVGEFEVRRALPRRARRMVGAWRFIDHMGPALMWWNFVARTHDGIDTVPRLGSASSSVRPRRLRAGPLRHHPATVETPMTDASMMPAVFIEHGSPMNTLEHNRYTDAQRAFGNSVTTPAPAATSCTTCAGSTGSSPPADYSETTGP